MIDQMKNSTPKPTTKRYNILFLIFVTVVINYMDRSNISIAASLLSKDLELSTAQMGLIFAAFSWTYSALQVPGGIMADLFRSRILYTIILVLWSLVTLLQGFANSLLAMIGFRAAIGVFEAPSYPTNNKIVTTWFPEKERASAIAVYTSGQFIGLAFLTPVLFWIQNAVGWRGLFIVSGTIGILWAAIWYLFYRDPDKHGSANRAELDYIKAGGGFFKDKAKKEKQEDNPTKFQWGDLLEVLRHKKLWGIYIGQFCIGATFWFFLTWFPKYLQDYKGMDFLSAKTGLLASVPFLGAFLGVLLSGFSSDYMIKKGMSNELARKLPILLGTLISVSIIGANYTDDPFLVVTFLTLAFFGNGLASITWIFVSLLAPKKMVGLVGGVFNAVGGLAGATVPIIIGFLVDGGDFSPALFFVALLAMVAFLSYIFLVGKVERVVPKGTVK